MTRRPPPRRRRAPRILLAFGLVAALALPATAQEETFDTGSPPEAPGLADPAGNLGVRSIAPPGVDPAFPAPADGLPALAAPYAAPETGATIAPGLDAGAIDELARPRLLLSARLAEDGDALASGVVWRVFGSATGPDGDLPLVAQGAGGSATFDLPPGVYFVYCGFGYAASTVRVEVNAGLKEETVVLNAGGLLLRAVAEDRTLGAEDDVRFDIYSLETDDRGERKVVARNIRPDELVRLAADTYHVVSRYGQVNAQTRGDVEVKSGKLTEVTLFQRAAEVTLKLVGTPGGEAIADTNWSVLTPGGDIVTEGVGAFPSFVLASGEYTVVARHNEKVYQRDFNVETGRDAEVEVLAQE